MSDKAYSFICLHRRCHVDDQAHKTARCMASCDRMHSCGRHPCNLLCYQECGPCLEVIPEPTTLPCGHSATNLPCYRYQRLHHTCTAITIAVTRKDACYCTKPANIQATAAASGHRCSSNSLDNVACGGGLATR